MEPDTMTGRDKFFILVEVLLFLLIVLGIPCTIIYFCLK